MAANAILATHSKISLPANAKRIQTQSELIKSIVHAFLCFCNCCLKGGSQRQTVLMSEFFFSTRLTAVKIHATLNELKPFLGTSSHHSFSLKSNFLRQHGK
jgi:hypothetical protein